MATIVSAVPSIARETKYNYAELFDGQTRRLVAGEDFDTSNLSFQGALRTRMSKDNEKNGTEFSVSIKFRTEDDKRVAYVTRVDKRKPKAKPAKKAEAKPAAKDANPAKPAAKKTAAKREPVVPNPKVSIAEANEAAKA